MHPHSNFSKWKWNKETHHSYLHRVALIVPVSIRLLNGDETRGTIEIETFRAEKGNKKGQKHRYVCMFSFFFSFRFVSIPSELLFVISLLNTYPHFTHSIRPPSLVQPRLLLRKPVAGGGGFKFRIRLPCVFVFSRRRELSRARAPAGAGFTRSTRINCATRRVKVTHFSFIYLGLSFPFAPCSIYYYHYLAHYYNYNSMAYSRLVSIHFPLAPSFAQF